jgi:hypothetical protein
MAATEGGVRAPRRLLIPTQLVEAGELTLHRATNITLKTEAELLRSRRIDSKEPIPPGCVAWRAGTTTTLLKNSSTEEKNFGNKEK